MTHGNAPQTVLLSTQPVELYKILKFEGIVASGAHAKLAIDDGLVMVNGSVETRRRRKIHHGDIVVIGEINLHIVYNGDVAS